MKEEKITIVLFECQISIILKALELYCYNINEKYDNRKISKSNDENSEKSLIYDTYHQLQCYLQFCENEFFLQDVLTK